MRIWCFFCGDREVSYLDWGDGYMNQCFIRTLVYHTPTHTHTLTCKMYVKDFEIWIETELELMVLYQCQFLGLDNVLWKCK